MKKYPAYKPSGVEWLGEVPAHWNLQPLKHVADFRSGGTPDKSNIDYWDGNIPWASAKDLKTDHLFDTADHITDVAVESGAAALVPAESVLVVVRGMILARIFPVTTAKVPMAINQDLKAIIARPQIQPAFMAWLLRGSEAETLSRLDEAGHGTKALRMDAWGAMRLPVPSLEEQSAIATFLNRETAKIDALVAEQQKLIALLKEKRQAVISHAVTKGLDPSVPMKDSGVEWLGEVPAHWDVAQFRRHVYIAEGQVNPEAVGFREMALIAPNHVEPGTGRIIELETAEQQAAESGKYFCKAGDVIYSKIRPALRKVCIAPTECLCSADMYPLRPHAGLTGKFLLWFILSEQFSSLAVLESERVAMPKINRETLNEVMVVVPPDSEQKLISEFIARETTKFDALTAEAQSAIALLQERRTALISAAVTGQIKVTAD